MLTDYAEFAGTPQYMLVDGVMGPTPVYKLKRVVANGQGFDFSQNNYYFSKELRSLISMGRGGPGCRGKVLAKDKYQKYSLRQKMRGNLSFSRGVKIDSFEIAASADNQI